MLGDFYIPKLSNDMKIAVQKNHLVGQILYRSLVPSKKTASMEVQWGHSASLSVFEEPAETEFITEFEVGDHSYIKTYTPSEGKETSSCELPAPILKYPKYQKIYPNLNTVESV